MGKTVEKKKRKKKGRPSLLDLQKRSLRLQKQQEEEEEEKQNHHLQKRNPNNPNPNSSSGTANPYLKFPSGTSTSTPTRRTTRRNPGLDAREEEDDDDEEKDDEESGGKRREKKLKLVLRLQQSGGRDGERNRTDLDSSGSEEEGEEEGEGRTRLKKRKIDAVVGGGVDGSGREKEERHNSSSKATIPSQEENEGSEPATPLPDKKLLVFILDRLQKKDTYGVFSEPVDPNELPDYHDIIKHPMDFSTVRKKLSGGAYANLEQFEKDVFLISSNAMRYNASDTIYFRQARSIQELAKKDFENLRQESDDNEPEPKVVRRGRPPSKNTIKKPVGRPPAEHAASNISSDATLPSAADNALWANSSNDMLRKGSPLERPGNIDLTRAFQGPRNSENSSWLAEQKSERNEESSGSAMKGMSTRYGKKVVVSEENRRNTYKLPPPMTSGHEPSILTTFDGEKKELVPVGLHMEHAYARSLARFAANLGPVGWEIAARQIEKALPPGSKFGRGWVGEKDIPQPYQPPLLSTTSIPPSQSLVFLSPISKADTVPERRDPPSNMSAVEESQPRKTLPPSSSSSPATSNRPSNPVDVSEISKSSNSNSVFNVHNSGVMRPKAPFQVNQNSQVPATINGFNSGFGFSLNQVGQMARPVKPTGSLVPDVPMTHAQALGMVSRGNNSFIHPAVTSHLEVERTKLGNPGMVNSGNIFFHPTASNHLEGERTKSGNPSTMNFTNNFIHPAANLEQERSKLSNSSAVNARNRFIHLPTSAQLEVERTKSGNPHAVNSGNNFMHPAATGHLDTERIKLGNPGAVNSGNSSIRPEATSHLEVERAATANSNMINSGNMSNQQADRSHSEAETNKLGNPSTVVSGGTLPESSQDSRGFWRGLSLNQKPDSTPPDLNVRFQSPGSPASGVVVDSQQPDLALQL